MSRPRSRGPHGSGSVAWAFICGGEAQSVFSSLVTARKIKNTEFGGFDAKIFFLGLFVARHVCGKLTNR